MNAIGAYYTFIVATNEARLAEERRQEALRPDRPSLLDRVRSLLPAKRGVFQVS